MKNLEIILPELHPAQEQVIAEAKRFNVLTMGRRWGKTALGIDLMINPAIDGERVGWFSPSYKMLLDVWRDTLGLVYPIVDRVSNQERRIELVTGGIMEMWSLDNSDAGRGRKYTRVIIDEAAMIKDLIHAWSAAIRPTLTDYRGDAWFLSTPKGRNGFWQLHQLGKEQPGWASWQMPTIMNPYIDPAEIEDARQMLPERIFAQEYLAEFLEDGGGVFRKVIEAAIAPGRKEHLNDTYVIGVDWGKHQDFTCITVLDVDQREMVEIDRFNQIDYHVQVGRLKAICERWKPAAVIVERNSIGEPLIENLMRDGLPIQPFTTTNASKAQIIDGLSLAFERGHLRIINDPVLTGELLAFDMERLPSGMLRYGAPEGFTDDCVMSLAMAWHGCINSAPAGLLSEAFRWN